ncbi:MAG: hypothetical protein KC636_24820, partial [Myxococcales bacterium]|nr:hypothetical protein [Myxococcales bacterium]
AVRSRDFNVAAIAYASIFARSPQDAADHLARLIVGQQSGFTGSTAAWVELLQEEGVAEQLAASVGGPAFAAPQWRAVIGRLIDALERSRTG